MEYPYPWGNSSLCALLLLAVFPLSALGSESGPIQPESSYGVRLTPHGAEIHLWGTSSGWKVGRNWAPPKKSSNKLILRLAGNEIEAVQMVVRPNRPLKGFTARIENLAGMTAELLRVKYVDIKQPTDSSGTKGLWPDPLPRFDGPVDLAAGINHPIWIRVFAPKNTPAEWYSGKIRLSAEGYEASVDLDVEVYGFNLPDKKTLTTAFGFSFGNVARYQNLKKEEDLRKVLDLYWAAFAAHHISPYNPAPLDPIRNNWPQVKAIPKKWEGGRYVTNEAHGGKGAFLVMDVDKNRTVTAGYKGLIPIPNKGLKLSFWYRTVLQRQRFLVSMNHYDRNNDWMPYRNRDLSFRGDGAWQCFEKTFTEFPKGAKAIRLRLMATPWTEAGGDTGLVWFDDVSLMDCETKTELLEGGDFESPRNFEPVDPSRLEAKLDFSAWDRAMERAMDFYHFNSISIHIPGMGGGTFHEIYDPILLGYEDHTPEYGIAFNSYCSRLEAHLKNKGWLDESYVYWFDEPSPDQYAFVKRGFEKLKKAAPGIGRMLTEQVEPELTGGPNIWCSILNSYDHKKAEERRKFGERFWWYVCTGPKSPYTGLFIDRAGTEMRVWCWQTFKRNIEGILVWQTNHWTSNAAYPDRKQNPYEDPMSWVHGYSTPKGAKRPWGNGDGRFIYPPEAARDGSPENPVIEGPVGSIRWEMLRDGIEDYEYLVMLKNLVQKNRHKLNRSQRKERDALLEVPESITRSLTEFTKDPAAIELHRDRIARAIVSLN